MGLGLDSPLSIFDDISRCREELDTKDNLQNETFIYNPETFKLINWVQWSKESENYIAQYKTARKSGKSLSYVINNNSKRPNAAAMSLLPQTEQEYCNITLDNRNMC